MKRILVLPGGGMLGLPQAAAIFALRQMTSRPIHQVADLIAGTSIGGINTLLIGSDDVDTQPFFTQDGPVIFRKPWYPNIGLWGSIYGAGPIEERLQARFAGKTVADLKTNVLVTGMDATSDQPFFLRSWNTSNFFENRGTPLWKVARFTSAAQHYFPGYQYGNRVIWDGGNVANNPAREADEAADALWGRAEPRKFLVLGCGVSKPGKVDYLNPSAITLLKMMVNMLFEVAAEDVTNDMTAAYGANYVECQPTFARQIAIDDASPEALAYLQEAGAEFVKASRDSLIRWLE